MAILGYVTADEIVDFMTMINADFEEADINEMFINSMYELINAHVGAVFEQESLTMLLDGHGTKIVYTTKIPIVEITRIAKINQDDTESELVISGPNRNVWWDSLTGRIWTKIEGDSIEYGLDTDSMSVFANRPDSVKVEGTFGIVATNLVKQLQLFLILKQYCLLDPSTYASDIIEEKIGRYSYKLANASNVEPQNQRKGLDGWIAFLFDQLPKENTLGMESI